MKRIDWCRWLGHKPTIELQGAINCSGCKRCGCVVKVDNRLPCSYTTLITTAVDQKAGTVSYRTNVVDKPERT